MSDASGPAGGAPRLARLALAFAFGLLLVAWVALQLWTNAYASVNPGAGSVSTSAVFWLFHVLLFLGGATLAFVAAYRALYEVLRAGGRRRRP